MELTREDTQKAKGIAILGMVMLHLFCRLGELPYTPWIWIGKTPLIYYFGLFGDICVPIYCFCSGYAHFLLNEIHGTEYGKTIPNKLLRFLINYWIVLLLFSVIGMLSGNGAVIPGSVSAFLGNILLYRVSYNGTWWFVVTYAFLCILSPFLIMLANRLHAAILIGLSGAVYFAAYLFRFKFLIDIPHAVLDWVWQQLVLLGTSQFGYMIGMVCRKNRWFSGLRECLYADYVSAWKIRFVKMGIMLLPAAAFIGHCVVQSAIVAPVTAAAVLICLFAVRQPQWMHCALLFLGRHSTNIWLVHMFFYLTLFEGFVFSAKYPVAILLWMLALCIFVSWIIHWIEQKLPIHISGCRK